MMFLGSFFSESVNATAINSGDTEYVEVTNAVFDDLYMDSDINAEYDIEIPAWGYSTILHAKFQNNILAGNINFTLATISEMLLRKRVVGTYNWTTIHRIEIDSEDDLDFYFNDIVVASNTQYEYAAVPIVSGATGTYQTITVDVWFDGCFVIDPTHGYQVIGELHRDNMTRKIPTNIIETVHSKYPYVHHYSESDYDNFSISGLWAEMDRDTCMFDMDNSFKYRKAIRAFANNKRTKIVKWYDGQIYMADSIDQVSESMSKPHQYVITTIPFVEVGDVESNYDLYHHGFINYLEVGV